MKNRIILAVALSIGLAASASAQIIMTNPGFELPNVASGGWTRYSITAFPGWTLIPGADAGRTFVNGEGNANMLKSPTSGDQSLGLSGQYGLFLFLRNRFSPNEQCQHDLPHRSVGRHHRGQPA